MSKKHYEALAAALRRNQPGHPSNLPPALVWENVTRAVIDVLASDNERFDRARFARACGLEG